MPKIKFDKKEFEKKVKELAVKHDVPEDVMREWLKETYDVVESHYRKKMRDAAREALEA
jgi:hypothetical protein